VTTSSATDTTSNKDDDFLKLNPTLGKPTSFEPSTGTTGSTAGETSMPIIPLNPDVASSSSTGTADKAVAAGGDWKPTELDAVKPSGAPGAGPSAPDYKVATPDTSLTSATSDKPAEHHSVDASKDTTSTPKRTEGVETSHSDTAKPQESVGGPIEEILNKGPLTKTEHTVDESEAKAPHSKMEDKTVRATTANKTGESGDVESECPQTPGAIRHNADLAQATPQRPPAALPNPATPSLPRRHHPPVATRRAKRRCRSSKTSSRTSSTLAARTSRRFGRAGGEGPRRR
jgi:hypothetical protein